jgi:hypothetical protein
MPIIDALQVDTPFSAISGQDQTKKDWFSSGLPDLLGLGTGTTGAGAITGTGSFSSGDIQALVNALLTSQGGTPSTGAGAPNNQSVDPFAAGGGGGAGQNTGFNVAPSGPTLATTNPEAGRMAAGILGNLANPSTAIAKAIGAPNIGQMTGSTGPVAGPQGVLGRINPVQQLVSQLLGQVTAKVGIPSGPLALAQAIMSIMSQDMGKTLGDLSIHAPTASFDPSTEFSLANMGPIGFSNTLMNMLGSKFFEGPIPRDTQDPTSGPGGSAPTDTGVAPPGQDAPATSMSIDLSPAPQADAPTGDTPGDAGPGPGAGPGDAGGDW